jgi:hypothetical protein
MVSSTASRSRVELTAWLTSPRALSSLTERVSSAVRASSSLNSRTFSMAIAAWSAKVVTSSICLSVNGWTAVLQMEKTPMGTPSRIIGTPRIVRYPASVTPL